MSKTSMTQNKKKALRHKERIAWLDAIHLRGTTFAPEGVAKKFNMTLGNAAALIKSWERNARRKSFSTQL